MSLRKYIFPFAIILLFVFISYGLTLQMYFWQDDSALIFKLQNPDGPAGSFGSGLWQRGAYQYLVVPFVPFFKLFGLEPFGYFFIGFVTYIFATFAFYYFAKKVFENTKAAFCTGLFFAAGYVGSDTMFRVINSWQTNLGLFFALLTFGKYIDYLKNGGVKKYLFSLALFLFTIEFVYVRSHSIIFPIFVADVLYRLLPFKLSKIMPFIIRQTPFWILFYRWFLQDASFGGPGIKTVFENAVLKLQFFTLTPLIATIGNTFVPDFLTQRIATILGSYGKVSAVFFITSFIVTGILVKKGIVKTRAGIIWNASLLIIITINKWFVGFNALWYRDLDSITSGLIGLTFILFSFIFFITQFKKNQMYALGVIFSIIIVVSQIFGYYSQYPTAIFSTTHRYLSYPFIGYSLFWGTLCYFIYKKTNLRVVSVLLMSGVLIMQLLLGVKYQSQILADRSEPSRKFYQDLKVYVPNAEKGSTFYFDIYEDPYVQKQFGDFFSVGSMPETTALAIYYNLDRYDVQMIIDFEELMYKLSTNQIAIDKLHTFYYGKDGLVDTTSETVSKILTESDVYDITDNLNHLELPATMPTLVTLDMKLTRADAPVFPYTFSKNGREKPFAEKLQMLQLLNYLKNYYSEVILTSTSEWKFREIRNAFDNNAETAWQGHRIWWNDNEQEALTLEFPTARKIGGLIWKNWNTNLAPTQYTIEASIDGTEWSTVKTQETPKERKNGETVVEVFPEVLSRFIRMNITKTQTNDSPALVELIAIPSEFTEVSLDEALIFLTSPFSYVENQEEWNALYDNFQQLAYVNIKWSGDKGLQPKSIKVPVQLSNDFQTVEFILPAGGTKIHSLEVSLPYPAVLQIASAKARNVSISELETREQIKIFTEN
jgi:hypothetical protein